MARDAAAQVAAGQTLERRVEHGPARSGGLVHFYEQLCVCMWRQLFSRAATLQYSLVALRVRSYAYRTVSWWSTAGTTMGTTAPAVCNVCVLPRIANVYSAKDGSAVCPVLVYVVCSSLRKVFSTTVEIGHTWVYGWTFSLIAWGKSQKLNATGVWRVTQAGFWGDPYGRLKVGDTALAVRQREEL